MITFFKKEYYRRQELFDDVFWRGLQVLGKQGISFLIFILSVKLLSPYDFGVYSYVFSIILVFAIFGDFGISTATSKFIAEYTVFNKDKLKSILFNSSIIIFCLAIIIVGFILFFGRSLFGNKYIYVLYLLPLVFLIPMTSLYDGIYRGLNLFKQSALISLLAGIISIFFIYFLISAYGLVGALISQNLFFLILFLGLSYGYRDFQLKLDIKIIRDLGWYSFIIGIGSIGFFLYSRVDILFLGHLNYIQEIAYYEIVNKLLILAILPFSIFAQVIAPKITRMYANKDYGNVYYKYKRYLFFSFILSTVFTISLFLLRDLLLGTFFSEYMTMEIKVIFNWMLIVFFTQMLNGIVPLGFVNSTGHAKISSYFLVIFGLGHIILNFIFLNIYGYMGIIYSLVITKGSADILYLIIYQKTLKCLVQK